MLNPLNHLSIHMLVCMYIYIFHSGSSTSLDARRVPLRHLCVMELNVLLDWS